MTAADVTTVDYTGVTPGDHGWRIVGPQPEPLLVVEDRALRPLLAPPRPAIDTHGLDAMTWPLVMATIVGRVEMTGYVTRSDVEFAIAQAVKTVGEVS